MLQTEIVRALLSYLSPDVTAELVKMTTLEGVSSLHAARRITFTQLALEAARDEIIAILRSAGGPHVESECDDEIQTDSDVTDDCTLSECLPNKAKN